ncbi:cobyrinate a,c-diamide synthase [Ancylobacter sp. 6x-1]|uniref:Hydrogenobyrinate a,c-diamide synthase n=1 Tax=Ancylobacter crimeensis TaxID=2579147 RepID=A0ABT0D9E8_9HYPH|nr:cobyrinate a,c-diamide synthase [Ancylobacter crimeensis]MCK0196581.1 cobyrinate a,c-diamide synthase [Ancylobacter crimeensis]
MSASALMIAAPRSGSGKTTVTLGLIAALRRKGLRVAAAKSGPDYIDPAFHAAATGRAGLNLDSYAMAPSLVGHLASDAAEGADLLLVEASMGLFDGIAGETGRTGAGADLAGALGLPVLLVVDVSGQSQSAAALVRGFASHDPRVRIAGVVLNRVASERHRIQASEAIAALGIPVLAALPREATLALPERHLGLVQAQEHPALAGHLASLADFVAAHADLDAIAALGTPLHVADAPPSGPALPPPGQVIALARDAAFSFIYEHVLEGWRRAGARIVPFSPLADEAPDAACDACWLPGGYPELHGARLAAATRFAEGMRRFAETRPVHGECGGFMVLGTAIEDAEGVRHPMLGLLGHVTSFARRRLNLGYRRARLLATSPLGPAGGVVRGHEFHYATVTDKGADQPLVALADGTGRDLGPSGGRRGRVSGSFFHAIAGE